MSRQTSDGSEGVIDRKMIFCPRLQEWEPARLMQICKCCTNFFIHCCACDTGEWHKVDALGFQGSQAEAVWTAVIANREANNTTCHHYRMLYVKGSTINSGRENAVAGLGFAFGTKNEVQGSLVVDKEIDPSNNPVTLQRAEILAAIEGLLAMSCWEAKHEKKARRSKGRGGNVDDKNWVIGTDSSYLVKAMTKAFPQWKGKHGKDADAVEPAHLDLLQKLHTAIVAEELKQRVKIGFWKIAKEHNIAAITNANNASMKAANERYTEAEKAELAEQRRAKSTKKILEAHTSTMTTSENHLAPLEKMPANTQVEKGTVSKPANAEVGQEAGRTKTKASLAGTEPDLVELLSKHLHLI